MLMLARDLNISTTEDKQRELLDLKAKLGFSDPRAEEYSDCDMCANTVERQLGAPGVALDV